MITSLPGNWVGGGGVCGGGGDGGAERKVSRLIFFTFYCSITTQINKFIPVGELHNPLVTVMLSIAISPVYELPATPSIITYEYPHRNSYVNRHHHLYTHSNHL